jgi:hypothetical protein
MRRSVVVATLSLAGLGLLVGGAFVQGYGSSVMIEIGAAFLLLAPLYSLQRRFLERQERTEVSVAHLTDEVRQVEGEVRETASRLESLTGEARRLLEEQDRAVHEAIQRLEDDVSMVSVRDMLQAAEDLRAIAGTGVRVRIPASRLRVRFKPTLMASDESNDYEPLVSVRLEGVNGDGLADIAWFPGDSAAQFFARFGEELKRHGEFPGNEAFDPATILRDLKKLVEVAIESRSGGRPALAPVIEVPNDEWAITEFGLECIRRYYALGQVQVRKKNWAPHMATKPWVDQDKFNEAFDIAQELFALRLYG